MLLRCLTAIVISRRTVAISIVSITAAAAPATPPPPSALLLGPFAMIFGALFAFAGTRGRGLTLGFGSVVAGHGLDPGMLTGRFVAILVNRDVLLVERLMV